MLNASVVCKRGRPSALYTEGVKKHTTNSPVNNRAKTTRDRDISVVGRLRKEGGQTGRTRP